MPETVNVPFPQETVAVNGIRLYTINIDDTQDVVRFSLVFRAGTRFQGKSFEASAALNMMREGTQNYTAAGLSEKIDFYGAYLDLNIDRDYSVISVCSLTRFLPEVLEILGEIVTRPAFHESEFDIYRSKRKQQLTIEREKVSFLARELFISSLYGENHPYGVSSPASDYDLLSVGDLKNFHKKYYSAGNCFAVASGKISLGDNDKLLNFLSAIEHGDKPEFMPLPEPAAEHKAYLEKEGAVQSAIRIGRLMFPRTHPDYIGMQVLSTVLGGYFGSRLIMNLREDKGLTYGIYSAMVNMESSGYFAIGTEVRAEDTETAIREIYSEIRRLREEPVSGEELTVVKNVLTGDYLRILDGPFGIADVTMENIQNGNDNDYVNRSLAEIKSITPQRLQDLAVKYFDEDSFTETIVGRM